MSTLLPRSADILSLPLCNTHYQLREYYKSAEGMRYHIVNTYSDKPSVEALQSALTRFNNGLSGADLELLRCGGKKATNYECGYWRVLAVRGEEATGYGCES